MIRLSFVALGVFGLAGCTAQVPSSNVGYGSNADAALEQRLRTQALQGGATGPGIVGGTPVISNERRGTQISTTAIGAPIGGTRPAVTGPDAERRNGIQASPTNAAPALVGNNGAALSDEQNFDAVSSRETIESDAQRRAAQAAAYQVVQPGALPDRGAETGPNIVDYALQTTNRRGQQMYRRTFASQSRMQRACAPYPSADAAQRVFLQNGGPQRDRKGMDPDGDGFACYWDPAPYRRAAQQRVTAPAAPAVPEATPLTPPAATTN